MKKIMTGGGFYRISDDKKSYIRTDSPTQDYLTLIRHATWIRLAKQGFRLRHFLS